MKASQSLPMEFLVLDRQEPPSHPPPSRDHAQHIWGMGSAWALHTLAWGSLGSLPKLVSHCFHLALGAEFPLLSPPLEAGSSHCAKLGTGGQGVDR